MLTETDRKVTTPLGPFHGHGMTSSWREIVHQETEATFSCECGYSTHVASEMDSHRHWEMVLGYQEALLDAVALIPADRWHLLYPATQEAIRAAQEERSEIEGRETDG